MIASSAHCQSCDHPRRAIARFCVRCGVPLAGAETDESPRSGDRIALTYRQEARVLRAGAVTVAFPGCPSCGQLRRAGAHFCCGCGQLMAPAARHAVPAAALPAEHGPATTVSVWRGTILIGATSTIRARRSTPATEAGRRRPGNRPRRCTRPPRQSTPA